MFNFFQSILDFLDLVIKFVVNFITGMIGFVTNLVLGSVYLIETVAFLPSPLVGTALTIIAIAVIFSILNR